MKDIHVRRNASFTHEARPQEVYMIYVTYIIFLLVFVAMYDKWHWCMTKNCMTFTLVWLNNSGQMIFFDKIKKQTLIFLSPYLFVCVDTSWPNSPYDNHKAKDCHWCRSREDFGLRDGWPGRGDEVLLDGFHPVWNCIFCIL